MGVELMGWKGPGLVRWITRIPSAVLCRLALFLMGYWWIDTEVAQVKRVCVSHLSCGDALLT